ncbi:MAG: hypothetical protein RL150_108 [Candidatus Parcubacteria bacterium]|jgi:D-alanine transaminase/branched-chain amino acid aminotransferase
MYTYAYLNGKIVRTDKPQLYLDDIGLLRGFGSFDFFRIYNKVPLDFDAHYARFLASSKQLGLRVPITKAVLKEVLQTLLKKNKVTDAHVRIILTGGKVKAGLEPTIPNVFVLLEPRKDLPAALYTKGGSLITFEHQRPFASAKTTNYQQAVVLQPVKKKHGAIEVLYIANGKVLEAATSNICIVKKGIIYAPKENVLLGITRQVVLSCARELGYRVAEHDVTVNELLAADEVFITATNKFVLPIVRIDGKVIANGKPGPISRVLNEAYKAHIVKECGCA